MGYTNVVNQANITVSKLCEYDSDIGYAADFSEDGNVDGWTYYDGIHTYGCWNNYLFGTLYGDYAVIGRHTVFRYVEAEDYHTVRIVLKLETVDRAPGQIKPQYGKVMWRTFADATWSENKSFLFDLYQDTDWHVYVMNMASAQYWQGDIMDLRIYPIYTDGRDGDQFYIRAIQILSPSERNCSNVSCDYFTNYEQDCPGAGSSTICKSDRLDYVLSEGSIFDTIEEQRYEIIKDYNDVLLININGYGFEELVLSPRGGLTGSELARIINRSISRVDVGGYAESIVEYSEYGEFIIYSGTVTDDSTIELLYSKLAEQLRFFDSDRNVTYTITQGTTPASGFKPLCSYKIRTYQLMDLFDDKASTDFYFDPFMYNVEGGRRDWLKAGFGSPATSRAGNESDKSGQVARQYATIYNAGQTLIDFSHPFNASGRITKIYAGITLDDPAMYDRGEYDENRKNSQLSGARIMFFRPRRNGTFTVLEDKELIIPNRDYSGNALYAASQEFTELDCDIWVNKGDLMGVYNAHLYRGQTPTGSEVDALYLQIDGKAEGTINPSVPKGEGSAGLLFYARSNDQQRRLIIDVDLNDRYNLTDVVITGFASEGGLEYNVARCLDIDWSVDMHNGSHTSGYIVKYRPLEKAYFHHPNLYYGKECLTDGIRIVPDGKAADSVVVQGGTSYGFYKGPDVPGHLADGGDGVIPVNPHYFQTNGDLEWLTNYLHTGYFKNDPFSMRDFVYDPISFTIIFPHGKPKNIYRYKIYFKEQYNFRSFALSTYQGSLYNIGDADDPRYNLIDPNDYVATTLDGVRYEKGTSLWDSLEPYLGQNPCVGHKISVRVGEVEVSYPYGDLSYFDQQGGRQYFENTRVINMDEVLIAQNFDWTVLEQEFGPFNELGFRFYCDYHESTKINEMELFCIAENVGASLGGSVFVTYSPYNEYKWYSDVSEQDDGNLSAFIGDTPRYLTVEVEPVVALTLNDVILNLDSSSVYMGDKGCDYLVLPTESKTGEDNLPEVIKFKNTFGRSYDLYVDIADDLNKDSGLIFNSVMNNADSIYSPQTGPDAYYMKGRDYSIRNYEHNVAINCPVYALKNLIDGAQAFYSHDNEFSWNYDKQLVGNQSISFSNLPDGSITTLYVPDTVRSKYWKIAHLCDDIYITIREMLVYSGDELLDVTFYHDKGQGLEVGAIDDEAPHLSNGSVTGSYYILGKDQYIGFELDSIRSIDKIVFYHDYLDRFENTVDIAGVDFATTFYTDGGDSKYSYNVIDTSYYEHDVTIKDGDVYFDKGTISGSYNFEEDFADCIDEVIYFTGDDGDPPDPDMWSNPINATIQGDLLFVTNSGVAGYVRTKNAYKEDFSTSVFYELDEVPGPVYPTMSGSGMSSSSDDGTHLASNLVDGVTVGDSYWETDPVESFPHWCKYDFGESVRPEYYRITSGITETDRMPNSWILQASFDNTYWYNIDTRTAQPSWHPEEIRTYSITNVTPYRYWRVYVNTGFDPITLRVFNLSFGFHALLDQEGWGTYMRTTISGGNWVEISQQYHTNYGHIFQVTENGDSGTQILGTETIEGTYTDNLCVGGTPSENLAIRNTEPYWIDKAFDDPETNSYWATASLATPPDEVWMMYDFGVGIKHVIRKVSIRPYTGRWKDFSIFGSNNAIDFTLLHSDTHANDNFEEHYYFPNLTAYRYIKIIIYNNYGPVNIAAYNIEMYAIGGAYFSMSRSGRTTSCVVQHSGETTNVASSQALGYDDFFVELGQDRGLFYPPTVGAYFDEFRLATMTDEWFTTSQYGSSFTCASGIYNFYIASVNSSNDGAFHKTWIYPSGEQLVPLNEEWAFEYNFKINISDYDNSYGILSAGVLWRHRYGNNSTYKWKNAEYYIGVQLTFKKLSGDYLFGLVIRSAHNERELIETNDGYPGAMDLGEDLYCRLKGDGNGYYTAEVWRNRWDGTWKVCDLSIDSDITWTADRVGVGSGGSGGFYGSTLTNITGTISDITFQAEFQNEKSIVNETSLRFDGGYLQVAKENHPQCNVLNDAFGFGERRYCIDFYIRLNNMPDIGTKINLAKCWDPNQSISTGSKSNCSWALQYYRDNNGNFYFDYFVVEEGVSYRYCNTYWPLDKTRWHYISLVRGPYEDTIDKLSLLVDGHIIYNTQYRYADGIPYASADPSDNDLIIGENLDGWMEVIRISTDVGSGGGRIPTTPVRAQTGGATECRPNPTEPYEYYYTFSLWNSVDNYLYGRLSYVDAMFNNSYSYYNDRSIWSGTYYSYYAIDMGRRYDLYMIRSYPINTSHQFNINDGVVFNNKEYDTPEEAFYKTEYESKPSTGFEGPEGDIPTDWTLIRAPGTDGYIVSDTFFQQSGGLVYESTGTLRADFNIRGDFDIWIDFELGDVQEANSWYIALQINDIYTSKKAVQNRREFAGGTHFYSFTHKDDENDWTSIRTLPTNQTSGKLRIVRYDQSFANKIVDGISGGWIDNGYYQMTSDISDEVVVKLIAYASGDPSRPIVKSFWDNFEFSRGETVWGNSNDARWLKIKLLNGDTVSRVIRYTGVYSDLTVHHGPAGGYNNEWISLGNSATDYYRGANVALGTTISGSGETGNMTYSNMVNGSVSDSLDDTWGSFEGSPQDFTIDLGKEYEVFRVVIYHGYNDVDDGHLVTDYNIQTSTDGTNFTTIFDIEDNALFERTHDLFESQTTRYIKMTITAYKTRNEYINVDGSYRFWAGAVIRQVEVYENDNFQSISSEDYPIICVNLQDKFYMAGHDLISMWAETQYDPIEKTQNWENINSNFCYSNSALDDPSKITFNNWGDPGGYAQWVAVKRNTATYYPNVPGPTTPYYDTEDFLKYVVVNSYYAPNPIEYPWWWTSNFSTLSYDYDYIRSGESVRSLKIDYNGSIEPEVISFLEGDHFGQDDYASWRDGIAFFLHIDDIDNLDLTYGGFYFGGYDQTTAENSVVYSWDMTTISGILNTGWNYLSLRFKSADNVEYTEAIGLGELDTRIVHRLTLGSVNFKFKGTGQPFTMYLDGFRIERNHFKDGSRFDYGLYLHNQDYMTCPLGSVSFTACTIEMYIRPDWYWDGSDYYGEFFNRAIFHFSNVNNDVLGVSISAEGLEIYYGNILTDLESFVIPDVAFAGLDLAFHFAIVVSNDGTGTSDGSTVQAYINNNLIAKGYNTWKMGDSKHFKFILGGQSLLSQKAHSLDIKSSAVDAVISNFKIYNYCKNDFISSMTTVDLDEGTVLEGSANFIEISADNLTYYNIDSEELPFIFRDVPANDVVEVFVKTVIPKGLTGAERRTSGVMGSWDVGV